MKWKAFEFNDKAYNLTHLHPRVCSYMQPAKGTNPPRAYTVEISFSMHCFTRGSEGEIPDPALLYSDSRETRIFDFDRYNLSQHLNVIINGLADRKCFHSGHGNYFTVEVQKDNANLEYEIYFTVSRSSKKGVLNLFVQSAYVRDATHTANKPIRKPIGFHVILYDTLNNKGIKVP